MKPLATCIVIVAITITLAAVPVMAQTPVISLTPSTTIIQPPDTVILELAVDANSINLKAYSVEIQNDPAVIRTGIADITEGPLLATSGIETFFWVSFSPDSQTIYIDGAILGDGVVVSGGGVLATLRFYGAGYGISEPSFVSIRARDAENMPLLYDSEGAWVRVCHLLGDVDGNHIINIADAVYLISWIFGGGPAPVLDPLSGDVDCNDYTNIADVVRLINYIFGGLPLCDLCFDWP